MAEGYVHLSHSDLEGILQHSGSPDPEPPSPVSSSPERPAPLTREQALALAIDLSRRSTPAEGGFRTFQPVVDGGAGRRAAVSRTFLYPNPEAQALLADATADTRTRRAQDLTGHDAGHEATWRERALNAEDTLKAAHAEIIQQRGRIGELLGQVRDLETE
jgi:hypothetical protein